MKNLKSLLRKCKMSKQDFRQSLLEWRNTPRANGVSPAQAFLGRRLRGCIPTLSQHSDFDVSLFKKNKQEELSKIKNSVGGSALPQLEVGDFVSIQDPKLGWWSGRGMVIEIRPSGSVIVENAAGRFIRKRRHVRRLPKNYSDPLPGDYLADADSALASPEFEGEGDSKLSLRPALRRSSRLSGKTGLANTVKKAGAFGGVSFFKWKTIKKVPKDQELAPKSSDSTPIPFPEHGSLFPRNVSAAQVGSHYLRGYLDRSVLSVSCHLSPSPGPDSTPASTCSSPSSSTGSTGGHTPAPTAFYVAESSRGSRDRSGSVNKEDGGLVQQSADQSKNSVSDNRELIGDTSFRGPFALNRFFWGYSPLFCHTVLCDSGGFPILPPSNTPSTGVRYGPTLQSVAPWPGPPWASMVLHGPPWTHPCSHGIGSDPPPVHASIGGGSSPLTEPSYRSRPLPGGGGGHPTSVQQHPTAVCSSSRPTWPTTDSSLTSGVIARL